MEDLKIKVNTPEESKEAQNLLFELGYGWHGAGKSVSYLESSYNDEFGYLVAWKPGCFSKHIIQMGCGKEEAREVTFPQLRDMVVLHRNNPEDATHENTMYRYREFVDGWYFFDKGSTNKWVKSSCPPHSKYYELLEPITKETLNDIARTAEDHRERNLANALNDLCADFGCPPGMDRFAWLKEQLDISRGRVTLGPLATKARMQQESMELRLALLKDLSQPQPVTYHYAASINTARGTVAYDGVITMPVRITGIEDYQKARAEIAKDGNVAPEQVNIHSLSVIN